ncbi:hypothetical protein MIR68_002317 [Amoeboaphelidium protococcarum]|nr:hypothetical protein MIR68_002317 [Amoeboaphelidium protococcarum]KAI3650759.1 hypothetical protein MP228_004240 [Amoeboaphelidium protococcarum]KAI3652326.1 hypothetical protein MP228_003629 [Amoeboaphelidium protococcarum]
MTSKSPLVDMLDHKVLVILRDGRKLSGILRSYDQYSNLILMDTNERIYAGKQFAGIPRGVFVVRGENLVFIGRSKEGDVDEQDAVDVDDILVQLQVDQSKKTRIREIKERALKENGYGVEMEHEQY